MARLPSVRLNEPTTTERSTLRLFSIPSSIADNSLLRFPWGDTVGIPRPAIFTTRDARKRKTVRHENLGELAPILSLRQGPVSWRETYFSLLVYSCIFIKLNININKKYTSVINMPNKSNFLKMLSIFNLNSNDSCVEIIRRKDIFTMSSWKKL